MHYTDNYCTNSEVGKQSCCSMKPQVQKKHDPFALKNILIGLNVFQKTWFLSPKALNLT